MRLSTENFLKNCLDKRAQFSAYSGNPIAEILKERNIRNRIHEKGYRKRPLTKIQMERNRKKSRTRARVEHVFGCIESSFKGFFIRSIGIIRARVMIGLTNLCYNIRRYLVLKAA
jgi:IS5 family transposase